jgi:membrane protease YdiL (CAAX protease family)
LSFVAESLSVSKVVLWGGAGLFLGVQLALMLFAGLAPVDSLMMGAILVALPALTLAQLPALEGLSIERLPAYWGSIGTLCLLGAACWLVGTRDGGASAIGATSLPADRMIAWGSGLAAAGLATILIFRRIGSWLSVNETPILRELLPRTRREQKVFALLSLAAGSGEEIAYRGYAIPLLASIVGVSGAVMISSLVFGVLHAYQGVLGIVRTAVMGGVLGWGFVASGSLWPSVIAHTVIDLVGGILLGDWLTSPPPASGVREGPRRSST